MRSNDKITTKKMYQTINEKNIIPQNSRKFKVL